MKIIDCRFKLSEEVLDTLIHLCDNKTHTVNLDLVYSSIGKTPYYVRNAIKFLSQIAIITIDNDIVKLSKRTIDTNKSQPALLLKKAITEYYVFEEYCQTLNSGKSDKRAAKIILAKYKIDLTPDRLISIFNNWLEYLQKSTSPPKTDTSKIKVIEDTNSHFWIDDKGILNYDERSDAKKLLQALDKGGFVNPLFIDKERINELRNLSHKELDLTKLILLCEELNDAYRIGNYYTTGILVRAIIDHIPPVFSKRTFTEVAHHYGSKSFRDTMQHVESFAKKIADGFLHTTIRRKENIPNSNTIDCRSGIDVLLGEIIAVLKS